MQYSKTIIFVAALLFALLAGAEANHRGCSEKRNCCRRNLKIAVLMMGNATEFIVPSPFTLGDAARVPHIEPEVGTINESACFRTDMVTLPGMKPVGYLHDCLHNLASNSSKTYSFRGNAADESFFINNKAGWNVFKFGKNCDGENNDLYTASYNDIAAVTVGSKEKGASAPITHWANSFPTAGDNHVLDASSGIFAGATGTVNLRGAVGLNQVGNGIIFFSCVFILDLEHPQGFPESFVKSIGQECNCAVPSCDGGDYY